jgi:hypothetical protein
MVRMISQEGRISLKGPIFGVPWIEIEFGQRPEGWQLFTDEATCIRETRKSSKKGSGGGSYVGPERPLCYYRIPLEGLDKNLREQLRKTGRTATDNRWEPTYKSEPIRIKD